VSDGGEYATSIHIEAPPAEVFPFLVDPALVVTWMGEWAELEADAGGRFAVDISGTPVRGEFVVVDPPHRVVFTWGAAGNDRLPPGSTTVEIVLRPAGGGTLVELVHRGLPQEEVEAHRTGWAHYLPRLATRAAGGDPGPDPWAPG
jgi:uncharacterized protein YndB with AHSA1/START domain